MVGRIGLGVGVSICVLAYGGESFAFGLFLLVYYQSRHFKCSAETEVVWLEGDSHSKLKEKREQLWLQPKKTEAKPKVCNSSPNHM